MSNLPNDMNQLAKDIANELENVIPRMIGKTGQDYFEDSFMSESWDGKPWENVERRKPDSHWYGFQYKAGGKRNFSNAATTRKILTGSTGELGDSIRHRVAHGARGAEVVWSTDKVYAEIQNEGGDIKVFGKHAATITRRQFIGFSYELDKQFEEIIKSRIEKAFRK